MSDRAKRSGSTREQKNQKRQKLIFSVFAIIIILSWILTLLVQ